MTDHVEAAVRALHPVYQRRMAHLVMRGWVFQRTATRYQTSWLARIIEETESWRYGRKIYTSSTLMTLLDQMVGIVEEMDTDLLARQARDAMPDGATASGGLPSR